MSGWYDNYAPDTSQQGFYSSNYSVSDQKNQPYYSYSNAYSAGSGSYHTPSDAANPGDQLYGNSADRDDEFANEPPLLEELGINPDHIIQKTLAVLNPFRCTLPEVARDADLAGPLVFCLAFGSLLLLSGKIHFNYIYGIGVLGCLAIFALLYLMATPVYGVSFTVVVSVLGYCMLPIVMLSALSVLASLQGLLGTVCAVLSVVWCAMSASKLFVSAFEMDGQQILVAYPCSILYAIFALITIF